MSKLQQAALMYGTSVYKVEPNETLPLPVEFDFSDPVECGKKVFAILSNASGGHTLHHCMVRIHRGRGTASMTCSGGYARYRMDHLPALLTVEEAMKVDKECEVYELGSVRTDQYGDGWKRAIWREVQATNPARAETTRRWRTA